MEKKKHLNILTCCFVVLNAIFTPKVSQYQNPCFQIDQKIHFESLGYLDSYHYHFECFTRVYVFIMYKIIFAAIYTVTDATY